MIDSHGDVALFANKKLGNALRGDLFVLEDEFKLHGSKIKTGSKTRTSGNILGCCLYIHRNDDTNKLTYFCQT